MQHTPGRLVPRRQLNMRGLFTRFILHDVPGWPCPAVGAEWDQRSAASCGQTRSDAVIVTVSKPLTRGNAIKQRLRWPERSVRDEVRTTTGNTAGYRPLSLGRTPAATNSRSAGVRPMLDFADSGVPEGTIYPFIDDIAHEPARTLPAVQPPRISNDRYLPPVLAAARLACRVPTPLALAVRAAGHQDRRREVFRSCCRCERHRSLTQVIRERRDR
jgi:hypothetical protein